MEKRVLNHKSQITLFQTKYELKYMEQSHEVIIISIEHLASAYMLF